MKFNNEFFSLIDISTTHNQFLFRSSKEAENVDLLFQGVFYYSGAIEFSNCTIYLAKDKQDKQAFFKLSNIKELDSNQNIFVIEADGNKYFIGAFRLHYQKNNLPPTETSIAIKKEEPMTEEDMLALVESVRKGDFDWSQLKDDSWIEIK